MSEDWLAALTRLRQRGEAAVLVTLLAVRGSTPREAGVKMVVAADASFGTIGGGNLEYQSVRRARTLLGAEGPVVAEFPLGPALGQCCGGHASVLFEPLRPPAWHIAVYGAGHVGRALVTLLGTLECRVTWIDAREGVFAADLPGNVTAVADLPPAKLPAVTFVLVMTHDHALDFDLVAQALPRGFPLVGVIGSDTKRARFVSRLAKAGVSAEDIRRLACPIGLPGIGGKAPAEIAISVAAQLMQLRKAVSIETRAVEEAPPAAGCSGCETRCAAAEELVR